jgi:hypothetical protein
MRFISALKRSLRDKAQRDFELKSQPAYWRLRRLFRKAQHFLVTRRFYTVEAGRNLAESSRILAALTRHVVVDVVAACGMFAILLAADYALQTIGIPFAAHHWPALAASLDGWSDSVSKNSDQLRELLNTIVQLAGLFLTLYFTAISLIASTVYARVPGDVRTLAVDEKVGNVYIRIVAILGALAILYVVGGILGLQIGLVGLATVATLSIVSLFSFLFLGKRTFNFFQPATFVQFIVNELAKWIKLAACHRRSSQTPSLQDYYRRRADSNLTTYLNIVSLATREEFNRIEAQALLTLLRFTVDVLTFYERQKSRIPSASLWFEQVNRHPQWLTAGHTELELALATGRPIDPQRVPNPLWFEERSQRLIEKVSRALSNRDDAEHWFTFANRLYHRLEEMGYLFAIDEALLIFRCQRNEIYSFVRSVEFPASFTVDSSNRRLSFCIGAIAYVCSDLIAALIGFARRLKEVTAESLRQLASDVLRSRTRVVYSRKLPRAVLEEIESLFASLGAEKLVEERILTPEWYISQLIARCFIENIKTACLSFAAELENTFVQSARAQQKAGRNLFAAQVVSSGVEACEKLHVHVENARKCVDELNTLRKVEDIRWPEIVWKDLHEKIHDAYKSLMYIAADILPELEKLPTSRYWPDYFGQLYSVVARESYLEMRRGDEALFKRLFPSLFMSSILANQKLRNELKDRDARTMLALSSGPVEDIVALSGYAKLFSELDGKDYYSLVARTWDLYLAEFPEPKNPLKTIVALLEYRTGDFSMPARDLERTGWQQNFKRLLHERGLVTDRYSRYDRRSQPRHSSRIILAICRGGMFMEHASDVFLVDYVMPKLVGEQITFPYTARHLAEELQRTDRNADEDEEE